MSAMAAAKMRHGAGWGGTTTSGLLPGAFVRALRGLAFLWPFLGGYRANTTSPPHGFALWVSRTGGCTAVPGTQRAGSSPWRGECGVLSLR